MYLSVLNHTPLTAESMCSKCQIKHDCLLSCSTAKTTLIIVRTLTYPVMLNCLKKVCLVSLCTNTAQSMSHGTFRLWKTVKDGRMKLVNVTMAELPRKDSLSLRRDCIIYSLLLAGNTIYTHFVYKYTY